MHKESVKFFFLPISVAWENKSIYSRPLANVIEVRPIYQFFKFGGGIEEVYSLQTRNPREKEACTKCVRSLDNIITFRPRKIVFESPKNSQFLT